MRIQQRRHGRGDTGEATRERLRHGAYLHEAIVIQYDVLGLHVSVQDAAFVEVAEGRGEAGGDEFGLRLYQPHPINPKERMQVATDGGLDTEVRLVAVAAGAMEADDEGVVQLGDHLLLRPH